jgi:hypothetical protein
VIALQGTAPGKPAIILTNFVHGPYKEDRELCNWVEIMEDGSFRPTGEVSTSTSWSIEAIKVKVSDKDGNTMEKTVPREMTMDMYYHYVFWGTLTAVHEPTLKRKRGGQSMFYNTFTVKELFDEHPSISFVRCFTWPPDCPSLKDSVPMEQ